MTSLGIAFLLALLTSILPYLATGWAGWESVAAIGLLTLSLWPLVASARAVVGVLYRLLKGRPTP